MNQKIISISDRGQITIPVNVRKKVKAKYFYCLEENGEILLKPMQTREEFLDELKEIEEDYDKNGGFDFEEVMKESQKT